jgi:uncharacterized protein YjbI with pentapeptide repeats
VKKEYRNFLLGVMLGTIVTGGVSAFFLKKVVRKDGMEALKEQVQRYSGLTETIRRSGLTQMMSSLLSDIDEEINHSQERTLTDGTIARIAALTYSLEDHTIANDDTSSAKKLSPERGHLLLVLVKMKIDTGTFKKIMFQSSFAGAVLKDADLRGADLRWVDLEGADLSGANLAGSDLYEADLRSANLWGADLRNTRLDRANLRRANLGWAELNEAQLKRTDLFGADLTSARLKKADLEGADLQWTELSGAFLNEANLTGANMFRSNLKRAHLGNSIMKETNLSWANLMEANLVDVQMTSGNVGDAELTGVVVSDQNWLTTLARYRVKGADIMQSRYKVIIENGQGASRFRLEKMEDVEE